MPMIGLSRGGWRAPRISVALQGGGAHGAFTWGVSGTSGRGVQRRRAGAWMGAGWCRRRPGNACEALAPRGGQGRAGRTATRRARRVCAQPRFASVLSPYELNLAGIDPLRELLEELVDFERLRRARPFKLLIAATNLRTGKGRVFQEHELTVGCVLASAALPQLHRSVEIAGELYRDGGYTSNVVALAERSRVRDIVIVWINRGGAEEHIRHPQPHRRDRVWAPAPGRAGAASACA